MDTTIAQTDSLNELSKLLQFETKDVINRIIEVFESENLLQGGSDDFGCDINEIASEFLGVPTVELFRKCFNFNEDETIEQLEFFGSLIFIGTGDCPSCGDDLIIKTDGENGRTWEDKNCPNCEYSDSGCPDFDCEPGGYDY